MLVLSADRGLRAKDLANSLAVELGWRYLDADEFRFGPLGAARPVGVDASRPTWLTSVHQSIAFAHDRRESLVVICPPLTGAQRAVLRGGLRPVRFILLRERVAGDGRPHSDSAAGEVSDSSELVDLVVDIDPHATPEQPLGVIRHEFGV